MLGEHCAHPFALDQTRERSSLEKCETSCRDKDGCVAFTFNSESKKCFLKETCSSQEPDSRDTTGELTLCLFVLILLLRVSDEGSGHRLQASCRERSDLSRVVSNSGGRH